MRTAAAPRAVAWYSVISSACAPVLLIGGWTLAAALQPDGFDQVRGTISALAGHGAAHRWVMTAALLGVGVCHCVTALGLRTLALPGRLMLAAGGVATLLVAAFPLPRGGTSVAHQAAATVAFACLALWPALSRPAGREPAQPPPAVQRTATLVLSTLVVAFSVALGTGVLVGLAERAAAGAQAIWPLATVLLVRRAARRSVELVGEISP